MQKTVLITGAALINVADVGRLRGAGLRVVKVGNQHLSDREVARLIKGVSGYILGGNEKITKEALVAADLLEAIAFTGVNYKRLIPAWAEATRKGIAITNLPDVLTEPVAEYTIALMLAMVRDIFDLGRTGKKMGMTVPSMRDLVVGVVGMGPIGARVAELAVHLGAKKVVYYSRSRKPKVERRLGIGYEPLSKLLKGSDVVTLHLPKDAGDGYIGRRQLAAMKDGAILINTSFAELVDFKALKKELLSNRIRAAYDDPPKEAYSDLRPSQFFCSNCETAFNTKSAIREMSRMSVNSMLNMLRNGRDEHVVNPSFRRYRR